MFTDTVIRRGKVKKDAKDGDKALGYFAKDPE